MKHYSSTAVVCPFYKQEQAMKIHCDGFNKYNTIQVSFKDEDYKREHRERCCLNINNYRNCPVYLMLEAECEVDL